MGLLILVFFKSFSGEISKAINGKEHVSGKVYWAVHSETNLENKIKLLPSGKPKDLLKKITSRYTLKNENVEICERCYEDFSENEQHFTLTSKEIVNVFEG